MTYTKILNLNKSFNYTFISFQLSKHDKKSKTFKRKQLIGSLFI